MSKWKSIPLGELLELVIDHRGKTPNKMGFDDFHDSGYSVLSAKHVKTDGLANTDAIRFANEDMYKKWMKVEVQEGDIVLTSEAPMGEVFYIDGKMKYLLSQRVFGLRPKQDLIDPLYLLAWLTSRNGQEQLKARASGSTVLGIKQSELLKIDVDVPPKEMQKIIAKNRFDLSKKIELNRQTNQTLEHIAQAIFKSWFVDFEPTRAKIKAKKHWQAAQQNIKASSPSDYAEPSDKQHQHTTSLQESMNRAAMAAISGKTEAELNNLPADTLQQLRTTAELFPDTLVESELGEIPAGWVVSEIGNEVAVVGGGTPSTKNADFWEGGHIHWTTPKDMSNLNDKILLNTSRKITEAGLAKISSGLLPENTVLMSSRAPVGYLAIAKVPVAINQGYIAMKCEAALTPEYVLQWADSVMEEIKQRASGTTFAEISKKNFKIIPVVVPSNGAIREYTNTVSKLYSKITEGINEVQYLTSIRDTLLPKLLSGELSATV